MPAQTAALAALDPERPLVEQVEPMLSRAVSPIWMDSSTGAECRADCSGRRRDASLAQHTGSRAFERFTGPQIRKFASHEPAAYAATDRIHLVSSFLASLLAGRHAPIDPGDGSGMNLMDLTSANWWDAGGRGNRTRPRSANCRHSRQLLPSSGRWRRTGRRDTVSPRRTVVVVVRATIRAA